jgi:hypothetical protein
MPAHLSSLSVKRWPKFRSSPCKATANSRCTTDGPSVKRLSSLAHYMVSRDPEEAADEDKVGRSPLSSSFRTVSLTLASSASFDASQLVCGAF